MTIDLAQFKNAEAWEYGDACRQAYWSRFGTTMDAAFFGPTNGALSPWPGHAENFCPVFLPDSTIITTSGMSSPWDPDGWDEDGGDTGEGLEYYLDSPRLAGASMEEIRQSWELALIMSIVSHFAGQNYRPTFDFYDCLTLRTRPVEALEDWADDEGMLCLLLGAASGVREDRIEMFGDPEAVRLIALTPIHPDEMEWARRNDDRGALGRVLTASPYRNQIRPDRPSLLPELEASVS